MAYRIEFAPEARKHYRALDARRRVSLRDHLLVQLVHEPAVETQHRKRLRPNWLGIKVRERVLIGGEAIDLS